MKEERMNTEWRAHSEGDWCGAKMRKYGYHKVVHIGHLLMRARVHTCNQCEDTNAAALFRLIAHQRAARGWSHCIVIRSGLDRWVLGVCGHPDLIWR